MVIYHQIKMDIGKTLRKLCEQKGIEIIVLSQITCLTVKFVVIKIFL